jgi:uncharacterized protein (DUF4415 family)
MKRADAIWNKGPELIDEDGEVRELTAADFKRMKPFSSLPLELQEKLKAINRGAQKAPVKKPISIRLSTDVLEGFKATGSGWQSRMDEALREWLAGHGKKTGTR